MYLGSLTLIVRYKYVDYRQITLYTSYNIFYTVLISNFCVLLKILPNLYKIIFIFKLRQQYSL